MSGGQQFKIGSTGLTRCGRARSLWTVCLAASSLCGCQHILASGHITLVFKASFCKPLTALSSHGLSSVCARALCPLLARCVLA